MNSFEGRRSLIVSALGLDLVAVRLMLWLEMEVFVRFAKEHLATFMSACLWCKAGLTHLILIQSL